MASSTNLFHSVKSRLKVLATPGGFIEKLLWSRVVEYKVDKGALSDLLKKFGKTESIIEAIEPRITVMEGRKDAFLSVVIEVGGEADSQAALLDASMATLEIIGHQADPGIRIHQTFVPSETGASVSSILTLSVASSSDEPEKIGDILKEAWLTIRGKDTSQKAEIRPFGVVYPHERIFVFGAILLSELASRGVQARIVPVAKKAIELTLTHWVLSHAQLGKTLKADWQKTIGSYTVPAKKAGATLALESEDLIAQAFRCAPYRFFWRIDDSVSTLFSISALNPKADAKEAIVDILSGMRASIKKHEFLDRKGSKKPKSQSNERIAMSKSAILENSAIVGKPLHASVAVFFDSVKSLPVGNTGGEALFGGDTDEDDLSVPEQDDSLETGMVTSTYNHDVFDAASQTQPRRSLDDYLHLTQKPRTHRGIFVSASIVAQAPAQSLGMWMGTWEEARVEERLLHSLHKEVHFINPSFAYEPSDAAWIEHAAHILPGSHPRLSTSETALLAKKAKKKEVE